MAAEYNLVVRTRATVYDGGEAIFSPLAHDPDHMPRDMLQNLHRRGQACVVESIELPSEEERGEPIVHARFEDGTTVELTIINFVFLRPEVEA